jgi:hypothetical protein
MERNGPFQIKCYMYSVEPMGVRRVLVFFPEATMRKFAAVFVFLVMAAMPRSLSALNGINGDVTTTTAASISVDRVCA